MKKIKTILFDLLYLVLLSAVIFVYSMSRPTLNVSDTYLIAAWILINLMLNGMFGSFFGKGMSTVLTAGVLYYLTSSFLYPLVVLLLGSIFIVLYFIYRKDYYSIKPGYRVAFILLAYGTFLCTEKYDEKIESANDGYCLNLTYSDYYDYHHFRIKNDDVVVEKFGKVSYLYQTLKNKYDQLIYLDDAKEIIEEFLNRNEEISVNEYTGIFEDCNVILIESADLYECFVSEELTPNIYKLKNEGINVEGFDNLLTKYATPNVEMMTNLSLFPSSNDGSAVYLYDDNNYEVTLANIFNNDGYRTYMSVNDYEVYYNRERIYSRYGYNDFLSTVDFGMDGIQNNDVVLNELSYYLSLDKSMVYYISSENPNIDYSYKEKVMNLYPNIDEGILTRMANLVELDEAIGNLMKILEESGKLDNTVFMIYGLNDDVSQAELSFAESVGSTSNTPLYIYKKGIEHTDILKKGSSLDILPTIANLFNLDYSNRTIIGRDLLDKNYVGMQITDDTDINYFWYNNYIQYNFWSGKSEITEGYEDTQKDILDMKTRMSYSYYYLKYSRFIKD